jgi:hypothetical protein
METVKVNKQELLNTVCKNRADHAKDYEDAMISYKVEAIKAIETLLTKAKEGDISHSIDVVKPKEFLKDYDRAIQMIRMSVDNVLELSYQDFDQWVMNNWTWRESFNNSTGLYKSPKNV